MRNLPAELTVELRKDIFCLKHLFVFQWSKTLRFTDSKNNIYYGGNWYDSRDIKFDQLQLSMNPRIDRITLDVNDTARDIRKIILSEDVRDKPFWLYGVPLDRNLQPVSSAVVLFMGYFDAQGLPIGKRRWAIQVYNHMIRWRRQTPRNVTTPNCIWEFKHGPTKVLGTDGKGYVCTVNCMNHTLNKPITGANWADYWQLYSASPGSEAIAWVEMDWSLSGTCKYVASDWVTSHAYIVGNCAEFGSLSYECLINHTSGTFATDLAAGKWKEAVCDRSWDKCAQFGNTLNFRGFRWLPAVIGKQVPWGQSGDPTTRAMLAWKARGH